MRLACSSGTSAARIPARVRAWARSDSSRSSHASAHARALTDGRNSAQTCCASVSSSHAERRLALASSRAMRGSSPKRRARRADQPGSCPSPSRAWHPGCVAAVKDGACNTEGCWVEFGQHAKTSLRHLGRGVNSAPPLAARALRLSGNKTGQPLGLAGLRGAAALAAAGAGISAGTGSSPASGAQPVCFRGRVTTPPARRALF
mmetsp:Transcript_58639/g.188568  ORF Transcript_58639/g.188568 Transcript_58639/m.188568 type:complete len:204 (+) Transcript_58639:598-1209(+)